MLRRWCVCSQLTICQCFSPSRFEYIDSTWHWGNRIRVIPTMPR